MSIITGLCLEDAFKKMQEGEICMCEGTMYRVDDDKLQFFSKHTNKWNQEWINDTFVRMASSSGGWFVIVKEALYNKESSPITEEKSQ